MLTDGADLISSELLSKLVEKSPTVVPGPSGMLLNPNPLRLSMDPTESDCRNGTDAHVKFRPSMVKFDSPEHSELCVVRAAEYHPLKLNRDVSNLVFSLSGEGESGGDLQPFPHIYNMQGEELTKMARMLTENKCARGELMRCRPLDHLKALLDVVR